MKLTVLDRESTYRDTILRDMEQDDDIIDELDDDGLLHITRDLIAQAIYRTIRIDSWVTYSKLSW